MNFRDVVKGVAAVAAVAVAIFDTPLFVGAAIIVGIPMIAELVLFGEKSTIGQINTAIDSIGEVADPYLANLPEIKVTCDNPIEFTDSQVSLIAEIYADELNISAAAA